MTSTAGRRPRRVGGVDGCRTGWVLVELPLRVGRAGRARVASRVTLVPEFATIVELVEQGALDLVGVDMPIGLPDAGPRACDLAARARLGPRRSSLFPTPPRPVLAATSWAEAQAISRTVDGKGMSKQAFNILGRIAEVDAAIAPRHQDAVFECHPESCFVTLAGAPLTTSKRTPAGRAERLALLEPHAPDVAEHLAARPPGAQADDVLDAFAVAVIARRHRAGRALVLGDGARDRRGLRMELVT